jgi:hypothetical protein
MITSRVWRGEEEDDARFAWVLEVRGLPSECRELRWEQFVSGGVTIEFTDRTWKYYSTQSTMQQINPQARQFGPWSDDLLDKMTPGPRPVTAYLGATCRGGVAPAFELAAGDNERSVGGSARCDISIRGRAGVFKRFWGHDRGQDIPRYSMADNVRAQVVA